MIFTKDQIEFLRDRINMIQVYGESCPPDSFNIHLINASHVISDIREYDGEIGLLITMLNSNEGHRIKELLKETNLTLVPRYKEDSIITFDFSHIEDQGIEYFFKIEDLENFIADLRQSRIDNI